MEVQNVNNQVVQNKYNNGKIYKLLHNDKVIYCGSTIQKLNERLLGHRNDSKRRPDIKVYKYVSNVGWDNVKIELIEEYNCNSKKELETRERYYIDELKPDLNVIRPGRTKKEYYNDNKDKIKILNREYKNNNKDKIAERNKIYRQKNMDKKKEKYTCECGSELTLCKKSRHEKSIKHMNYINNLNKQ